MTQRPIIPTFLCYLSVFAGGILIDRAGWLPGRPEHQPTGLRQTFAPYWEAWGLIHKHYADRPAVNDQKLMHGSINGMVNALGDVGHSSFLRPDQRDRLRTGLAGELQGIGARLTLLRAAPRIVVTETMLKSPARQAGLRAGDEILAVDGKSVERMYLGEILALVRGKPGTSVRLKIKRGELPLELTIKRAKIEVNEVAWQRLPGQGNVVHLAFHRFTSNSHEQMQKALKEISQSGAKGLILDLRGNPGGYKEQAVKIAGEFLNDGQVVFIQQDGTGAQEPIKTTGSGLARKIPLVALIDGGTASSAEILAGAIQDHKRGTLVGTRTFGTGTVLREYPLSDGSSILIAIYQWLTPSGKQVWHRGVSPDKVVSMPYLATALWPQPGLALTEAEYEKSEDVQLKAARQLLK